MTTHRSVPPAQTGQSVAAASSGSRTYNRQGNSTVTTTQEQNKKNVKEYWIEVLQNQRVELIPKLLAANYKFNGQPASVEDNTKFVASLHEQYPGFTYIIYDLIAEGEQVAIRWRLVAPATATRGAGYCLGANLITGSGGKGVSNWQVNEPFTPDAS